MRCVDLMHGVRPPMPIGSQHLREFDDATAEIGQCQCQLPRQLFSAAHPPSQRARLARYRPRLGGARKHHFVMVRFDCRLGSSDRSHCTTADRGSRPIRAERLETDRLLARCVIALCLEHENFGSADATERPVRLEGFIRWDLGPRQRLRYQSAPCQGCSIRTSV